jgi:hypothetical protein
MSHKEYSVDLDESSTESTTSNGSISTGFSESTIPQTICSPTTRGLVSDRVKHLVYQNISRTGGFDDFTAQCNLHPEIYGPPASDLRNAVRRFRKNLIQKRIATLNSFTNFEIDLVSVPGRQPNQQYENLSIHERNPVLESQQLSIVR